MIKAVLFDLDGVLVSTDEYHYRSWKKLSADEGFDFFDHEFNHKFRGVARMECIEIITKTSGKHYTPEQKQELANRKNRYFVESLANVTTEVLLPGAVAALNELRSRGIKTAVASNSRNAVTIIKQVNIAHLLDAVVDGHQIENSKPDPEVFLLAAKKVNVPPPLCLVVEDAIAGIESARRAGMKALGIGTRDRLPNADIVVPDLSAISVDNLLKI
ncbi:MAG: beta-phosphoglucomutase [Ignavibacteriae bacterium]|nr:MAG: beta-phosphoglucomutase [Ignavibacteriota bacterium]